MAQKLTRKQIGEGVHFSWIKDEKFKHNRISIHALLPLSIETVSHNAIIPLLLRKGSRLLAENENVYTQLNHLYGASLNGGSARYSNQQRLSLSIQSLDNAYAMEGEDLITQSVKLLLNCFLHPNFQRDFEVEKQYLVDIIESDINEKRSYAIDKTLQAMFAKEGIAVPRFGTTETAQNVTPQSVESAWKTMLKTAPIEIIFTGAGDPELALAAFEQAFSIFPRKPISVPPPVIQETAQKITHLGEELPGLQQGKLVMGFRSKKLVTYEDRVPARVFSALYGGAPFSKLFMNVREKLGLCYYCAARFDSLDSYLLVDSGVEAANKEKAEAEVLVQLEEMKKGAFTKEELDNTKMLLENAIRNTNDSLGNIENWYLSQILLGKNYSPEEDIALLQRVTPEQLSQIAKGVSLDTVYFLTGKDEA